MRASECDNECRRNVSECHRMMKLSEIEMKMESQVLKVCSVSKSQVTLRSRD